MGVTGEFSQIHTLDNSAENTSNGGHLGVGFEGGV